MKINKKPYQTKNIQQNSHNTARDVHGSNQIQTLKKDVYFL